MNNRFLSRIRPGAFRLFLAITVLVSHSCRFELGDWAVYTFFVLSGYWIHRMWTQKYSRARAPFVVFICSRAVRLLPVFCLVNLLSALVIAATNPVFPGPRWGWLQAAASNTLLLGYANLPFSQGGLRVAWTLDIEMQFYIAFPLALFLCTRGRAGILWTALVAAYCVAGFAWFLIPPEIGARHLGCFGLFFLLGAASAHLEWRPAQRWAAASLLITVALVVACWSVPAMRYLVQNAKHGATDWDIHVKRIFQAALAVISAPLALLTVNNPSGPSDRRLGEFTYVLYLVHWPIMMLHTYFFEHLPPLRRLPSVLAAWVLVAAASVAVFRFFDQPIERRRRQWVALRVAR